MNTKIKSITSQFVNNIGGNNIKITGTDLLITKEEYDNLIHRNEVLEALERGGVDNWQWYGESIQQYFSEPAEDDDGKE